MTAAPTDPGLPPGAAAARLAADGPNRLRAATRRGPGAMLLDQLRSPFVLLLGGAAGLAFALGERVDAVAIGLIVAANAGIGALQEHRAERALSALARMTAPRARVRRGGLDQLVPAADVVVGDRLLLRPGDVVAADARVAVAAELATLEAALTGESAAVDKTAAPAAAGAPLAERRDHVFAGTAVVAGVGEAEVVATGMRTELGRIAAMLDEAPVPPSPLQAQLARVSRALLALCLGVVLVVALSGLSRGQPWPEVLVASVALAVAAVPEGLPAVVTVALAWGVRRMAAQRVLIRRLPVVEALGSVTTICTDKTGTLTTGEMRVWELWTAPGADARALIEAAAACTDARLPPPGEGAAAGAGAPTELALLHAARERGIERPALEAAWPRVAERPFSSARKRMSVTRAVGGGSEVFLKGALGFCGDALMGDLDAARAAEGALAARGLRVLAVARGPGQAERGLRLLGLVGLADPPRPSAKAAVARARAAGIRTQMLTGDHPDTAAAIARELGILGPGEDPAGRVAARVTPADKLRIVQELVAAGEIVAMTGDGVNDAPAVRVAHVGIAMGVTGTEVTREAASVVLADDRFASIVEGVREGRAIHENIRNTVLYLVAGNAAELAVMLGGSLLGAGAPLLPTQLLWVNLVTDALPALALAVDPPHPGLMARPPRPPGAPLISRRGWAWVGLSAALEAAVVLGVYLAADPGADPARARTRAFGALVCSELLRAFAFRGDAGLRQLGRNPALIAVVVGTVGVQALLPAFGATRRVFHLAPIGAGEGLGLLGLGLVPAAVLLGLRWARGRRAA